MIDNRTTFRELDEMIARSQSAAEREAKLVRALPACSLRTRKQRIVRKLREHLQQLLSFRSALKLQRRPEARLH